jgi:hypothetical protein
MMPNAVRTFASLPGFVMAGFLPHSAGRATLRMETSASISWKAEASLGTVATACEAMQKPEVSAEAVVRGALKGMGLAGLAKSVFPNSRPMEDWEKKATDDFVLSLFR